MKVTQVFRFMLAAIAVCIVTWSFGNVGSRVVQGYLAKKQQPVTLTILYWGDPSEVKVVRSLVDQFEKQHPLVNVSPIPVTALDFDSKLKTMMAAGTPPDLFYLTAEDMPDLASMKLIAPLDDRFAKEPKPVEERFLSRSCSTASATTLRTQQVGRAATFTDLPKDFTTAGFYVNLDLFQKAGVPVPYDGWTWDEFEADIEKDHRPDATRQDSSGREIYGGCFRLWPDTLRNVLWTYGGDFFGPGGFSDVTLDSPQSQDALQMICRTRLVDKTVLQSNRHGQRRRAGIFHRQHRVHRPGRSLDDAAIQSITHFQVGCGARAIQDRAGIRRCITPPGRCRRRAKNPDESYRAAEISLW